ncbi:MAG: flagellar basal body P-ring formation chaperone FlgA [Candidatus Eisenbacteria bacterium]
MAKAAAFVVVAFVVFASPIAAAPPEAPPEVTQAIARAVASLWRIAEADVVLDLGAIPPGMMTTTEGQPLRAELAGAGNDGYFAVTLLAASDPAAAAASVAAAAEAAADAARRISAFRVRAGARRPAAVAARDLPSGYALADGDIAAGTIEAWGRPEAAAPAAPGWETRRALTAGEPLTRPAVQPPLLVRAGTPIRLEWSRERVRVSVLAKALQAARLGERVRARVAESGAVVEGTVIGPDLASLGPGLDLAALTKGEER